jgi:cell division protein FtsL
MPALPTAMVQLYTVIATAALVVAGMSVLRRRRRTSLERDVQRLEHLVRLLRAGRELREELDLREEGA